MFNTRITNLGSEIKNFGAHVNKVTGAGAAVGFVAGDFPGAQKYVLLQIQGQITRVSYDGNAPTAADGERKNAGDETLLLVTTVLKMQFITEAGAGNVWAQPCDVT